MNGSFGKGISLLTAGRSIILPTRVSHRMDDTSLSIATGESGYLANRDNKVANSA